VPQATWEWYFKAVSQRFKGCVLVDMSDDGRSRGKRNRYRVVHDISHIAIWQPNPDYARTKSAKKKKAGQGTWQREGMDGWPGDAFGLNDVDQACTETLRRWADEGRIPRIDDKRFSLSLTQTAAPAGTRLAHTTRMSDSNTDPVNNVDASIPTSAPAADASTSASAPADASADPRGIESPDEPGADSDQPKLSAYDKLLQVAAAVERAKFALGLKGFFDPAQTEIGGLIDEILADVPFIDPTKPIWYREPDEATIERAAVAAYELCPDHDQFDADRVLTWDMLSEMRKRAHRAAAKAILAIRK
jgi:hypothetical protein